MLAMNMIMYCGLVYSLVLYAGCYGQRLNTTFNTYHTSRDNIEEYSKTNLDIKALVLLPKNELFEYSMSRLMPAIELVTENIASWIHFGIYNVSFSLSYADSKCSEIYAMKAAIASVYESVSKANVFFGPVCNVAVAPVARQSVFWNIPLLSVGAFADDFLLQKQNYALLTRAGPSTAMQLSDYVATVMKRFYWSKASFVRNLFDSPQGGRYHYITCMNLHNNLKNTIDANYNIYDIERADEWFTRLFLEEISNKFAGKYS